MTKQQEILHYYLRILEANYSILIPAISLPFIKTAMQKYAEEYHQSELIKLNKSDVISSVCDHYYARKIDGTLMPCEFCGIEKTEKQTDL